MNDSTLPTLDEYVDIDVLHPEVQSSFCTIESLRWFARQHRPELVRSAALIIVAGRMRFHTALFKRATVEIGQKAAA